MQLTGNQIVKEGIITNYDSQKAVQQQGIDLRVKEINAFDDDNRGTIFTDRTSIPTYRAVTPARYLVDPKNPERSYFYLRPGYYEVQFMEGCKMPSDRVMHLKSRSSLVRCGGEICAGQFDAGFETDHMGCFLAVFNPMYIEAGARICQAYIFETDEVTNLYDGQWQGDKQRIKKTTVIPGGDQTVD